MLLRVAVGRAEIKPAEGSTVTASKRFLGGQLRDRAMNGESGCRVALLLWPGRGRSWGVRTIVVHCAPPVGDSSRGAAASSNVRAIIPHDPAEGTTLAPLRNYLK